MPVPSPFQIQEQLLQIAPRGSLSRGREYLNQGAVLSLERDSWGLQAEVRGTASDPYRVQVRLGSKGLGSASCTCPYMGGDFCKHIVAVVLAWLRHSGEEPPPSSSDTGP